MKSLLPLVLSLLLAACHTPPAAPPLPLPTKSAPEPRAIAAAPSAPLSPAPSPDPKLQEQAQLIDALLSQNDTLTTQVATLTAAVHTPVAPSAPVPVPPSSSPETRPALAAMPPSPPLNDPSMLVPNADGVIDVAAVTAAQEAGESTNPFAVRAIPTDRVHEVTLRIAGLVGGERPCAVVNDRRVQTGDRIESLTVERIETDAVVFAYGEHRLRLPVAETPTRVRLPL